MRSLTRAARARVPSVASIDDGERHEPKGFLKFELRNENDCEECNDGTERRIEVCQPGERELTRHPPDLGRRGGKAGPGFEAVDPGVYIFVFGVDLDLYSIEGVDIRNKSDIGEAEWAS